VLSPLNPLGIKGAARQAPSLVGPLFAQAIEDALDLNARGIEILEIHSAVACCGNRRRRRDGAIETPRQSPL
jgi:hypothetical protein